MYRNARRSAEKAKLIACIAPAGPLAAGYAAELVFFGMYSMLFIQHCTTGQFSALRSRALKATLVVLFVLQTALSAFNFAEMYKSMVRQSRTIDWMASGTPEWNMIPLLGGLIAAISQAVLSQRAGTVRFQQTQSLGRDGTDPMRLCSSSKAAGFATDSTSG